MQDSLHLLRTRRFLPIFATQFLGAFNDNLFRTSMVMLVIYGIYRDAAQEAAFSAIAGGLFILPFFLLSALSGQLADAHDKAKIVRIVKTAEIVIMIFGAAGLLLHNVPLMLAALAAMGVHSTFFGPIKYAILPQHLDRDEVLGGTGLVEAGTYIAILGGTILGGLLVLQRADGSFHAEYAAVGGAGRRADRPRRRRVRPARPAGRRCRNPGISAARDGLAHRPRLDHAGQRDPAHPPPVPRDPLRSASSGRWARCWPRNSRRWSRTRSAPTRASRPCSSPSSRSASRSARWRSTGMLKGQVSARFAPSSALLMGVFVLLLYRADQGLAAIAASCVDLCKFLRHPIGWADRVDLLGVAIAGGMFVVPLYAFLTTTVPKSETARTVAANNIVNSGAMVVATLIADRRSCWSALRSPRRLFLVAVASVVAAWLGWKLHLACD